MNAKLKLPKDGLNCIQKKGLVKTDIEDINCSNSTHLQNITNHHNNEVNSRNFQQNIESYKRKEFFIIYSKVQYYFNTSYESLFLAISVLDEYCRRPKNILEVQYMEAMSCLMLALKYEEIYAPSVFDVSKVFGIENLSCYEYQKVEKNVFIKLNMNLNLSGPHRVFFKLPNLLKIPKDSKNYLYFLLEIVMSQVCILKKFSWEEIMTSIQMIFDSLKQSCQKRKYPRRIMQCGRFILYGQSLVFERCRWVNDKYNKKGKFGYCANKPLASLIFE